MTTLTFTLAGHPPSPNATLRQHFMAKAKDRAAWRTAAHGAALQAMRDAGNGDDYPLARVRIRVVLIVPDKRRRDPDNAVASAKNLIDGCVDAGVIRDDSFAVVAELCVTSEIGPTKAIRLEVIDVN